MSLTQELRSSAFVLRQYAEGSAPNVASHFMMEAVAEIERLRTELAAERERCAKIAENGAHGEMSSMAEETWTEIAAKEIAAAIRAQGKSQ